MAWVSEGCSSASDCGRRPRSPGLMTGETGITLVSWMLAPSDEKADRLFDLVSANRDNPSHELFDGSPGTMLAALHLYEQSGDARWRDLWLRCADTLLDEFRTDPEYGCRIWIQYRRGRLIRSIGAGHGFASNVHTLLRGAALLGEARTAELHRAAAETAMALCLDESGLVNWPTAADRFWAEQFPIRVQWCHGAPGLVTSLASLPRDDTTDRLLDAAGELTWHAGPASQGAGSLPRHRGQRLRVPRVARAHGRRGVAPSRPHLRDARARAGGAIATRTPPSGRARSASRSISGAASTAGTGCPSSTFSRGLSPRRGSAPRSPRCGRRDRRSSPSACPTPGRSGRSTAPPHAQSASRRPHPRPRPRS